MDPQDPGVFPDHPPGDETELRRYQNLPNSKEEGIVTYYTN